MNMEKAYNDQLSIMKQMVAEMQAINKNLVVLNQNVIELGTPNVGDFLNEILGGLGELVDGSELARGLDEVDDNGFGLDDILSRIDSLEEIAEEYIYDLINEEQLPYDFFGIERYAFDPQNIEHDVDFEVNEITGVITAYFYSCGDFVKKAEAKCNPNDVFIPMVGKAIALFRLFDRQVPKVLLQN